MPALIGTAGWSLPRAEHGHFAGEGSHLERYARRFAVAEINSSFHRSHRAATWKRWRESVPAGFRFSVKFPKSITHKQRLKDADELLSTFFEEVAELGQTLGCLLVQLPPSLAFDPPVAESFFANLRMRTALPIACEPRHESWFDDAADALLNRHQISRAAADPARVPAAAIPGGWPGMTYYRLHGSPKVYYSAYEKPFIERLATQLRAITDDRDAWVIFDNTTLGAATRNALDLAEMMRAA